ncbi:MAG TPA: DNA polymerase/3'-5' exonuclease PolX [Burkholderiaceae bacterium]
MHIANPEVASVFSQVADLLEIRGDNPFRIRAYRNAARTINNLPGSIETMVDEKRDLEELPGIGADLAGKIAEIVHTGTCSVREALRREMPSTVQELLRVPGLGPKRVRRLYGERHIQTLEQLQQAARAGQIADVPGFGKRIEQRILQALEARLKKKPRISIAEAERAAQSLMAYLKAYAGTKQVEVGGSYRRRQETVGDLDILASASNPAQLIAHFARFDGVARMQAQGRTRASAVLRQGLQVDLRAVADVSFGAALHYFTGSKAHNIAVRMLAQEKGWKLNEYGLFSGMRRIAGETEESVFKALGLPYIEPELRENRGEIAAAKAGTLPRLIELSDLKGDLHAHTTASDGQNSLREMALAARRLGFSYLGITDHASRPGAPHSLDADGLARQMDEIDRLNAELTGITLLKGIEVDIEEHGRLALPDAVLERLDLVIGAVHSHFALSKERQTERIMRAMDHPCFSMLAHPSGRLIGERDAYAVDMPRIIGHAKRRACHLELDAQPQRLDLNDIYCRMAKEEGVLLGIDSDAHGTAGFGDLRFGIGQARRGWLEKTDVLNALPLERLRKQLQMKPGGREP